MARSSCDDDFTDGDANGPRRGAALYRYRLLHPEEAKRVDAGAFERASGLRGAALYRYRLLHPEEAERADARSVPRPIVLDDRVIRRQGPGARNPGWFGFPGGQQTQSTGAASPLRTPTDVPPRDLPAGRQPSSVYGQPFGGAVPQPSAIAGAPPSASPQGVGQHAPAESPLPSRHKIHEGDADDKKAQQKILGWVKSEPAPDDDDHPDEININTPEHNAHVAYAVNWALERAGMEPGKHYTPKQLAKFQEEALKILTQLRRQSKTSSLSLILRDAQRYLYGLGSDEWLRNLVSRQYKIPLSILEKYSGPEIDRVYNELKKDAQKANHYVKKITGVSPGFGRTGPMPGSAPGGSVWYDQGHEIRAKNNYLIEKVPAKLSPAEPIHDIWDDPDLKKFKKFLP